MSLKTDSNRITLEQFNQLLKWLDPDREVAGQKYESIRKRLVKSFVIRGVKVPEELADDTFNRVVGKLPEILPGYVDEPVYYFLGVARYIYLEYLKMERERNSSVLPTALSPPAMEDERDSGFLQQCLAKLLADDRRLITSYYDGERNDKIVRRRKLAEEWGISMDALRIRACRIRKNLMGCVEQRRLQEAQ